MKPYQIIPVALIVCVISACRAPISEKLNSVEGTAGEDHRELDYRVWLPPGYDENNGETYPLLIWFHGGGENEDGWGRVGRIGEIVDQKMRDGKLNPFIVVSPSAGTFTPIYAGFERVLFEELLPEVRKNYPVDDSLYAFGHSMGGLTALMMSLRNPEEFDAVVIASPFVLPTSPWDSQEERAEYDESSDGPFVSQWRYRLGMSFNSEEQYREWDPYALISQLENDLPFDMLLTVGNDDPLGLYPQNNGLHELLESRGVTHEWYVQEGVGHGTVEDPYLMEWLNEKAHD